MKHLPSIAELLVQVTRESERRQFEIDRLTVENEKLREELARLKEQAESLLTSHK